MDFQRQQPQLDGNRPSLGISSADTGVFKAWHGSILGSWDSLFHAELHGHAPCAAAGLQGVNRPVRTGVGGGAGENGCFSFFFKRLLSRDLMHFLHVGDHSYMLSA